jgi:phospho-N-acetylmuramoyl-pentapeptide-transferase
VTAASPRSAFLDDLDKVTKASHRGIRARARLLIEFLIAALRCS